MKPNFIAFRFISFLMPIIAPAVFIAEFMYTAESRQGLLPKGISTAFLRVWLAAEAMVFKDSTSY
jgi:hypothetical protein